MIGAAPLVWVTNKSDAERPIAEVLKQMHADDNNALGKILNEREMRQALFQQGWRVDAPKSKGLSARIAQDTATYRDLIARNKIRID